MKLRIAGRGMFASAASKKLVSEREKFSAQVRVKLEMEGRNRKQSVANSNERSFPSRRATHNTSNTGSIWGFLMNGSAGKEARRY